MFFISALQELEIERKKNEILLHELNELKESNEQILRVSNIMKRELEDLKETEKREKENAVTLRYELFKLLIDNQFVFYIAIYYIIYRKAADDYKKERNVLAHQSTLLMQGLHLDDGLDKVMLLQEIEDLRRALEDERNQHNLELSSLQVSVWLVVYI